jgi:hypothetical protein
MTDARGDSGGGERTDAMVTSGRVEIVRGEAERMAGVEGAARKDDVAVSI